MTWLAQLKAAGLWLLGLLAALGTAVGFYQKARRETDTRKAAEAARDIERRATDAALDGIKRQKEATDAPVDVRARKDFESR